MVTVGSACSNAGTRASCNFTTRCAVMRPAAWLARAGAGQVLPRTVLVTAYTQTASWDPICGHQAAADLAAAHDPSLPGCRAALLRVESSGAFLANSCARHAMIWWLWAALHSWPRSRGARCDIGYETWMRVTHVVGCGNVATARCRLHFALFHSLVSRCPQPSDSRICGPLVESACALFP